MFDKILNLLHHEDPPQRKRASRFDHGKLGLLFSSFPIGRRLRYYPEYLREATLETIVIGYDLNGHFVYANDAMVFGRDGQLSGFLDEAGSLLPPASIDTIHILIPDTSEHAKRLDYATRAKLGRSGQFGKGNNITLVAQSGSRSLTTLDTSVSRKLILKDGPYSNDAIVILEPDISSLAVTDKRKKQRVSAALPAKLLLGKDGSLRFNCTVHDFCEDSLRLEASPDGPPMPGLNANDLVSVEFRLADTDTYRFRGKVLRADQKACVIRTEQFYENGAFRPISLMDVVEVKTRLLNTAS